MTAIAALKTKTNVIMGGDSAGIKGWSLKSRKDSKVFSVGPFLIGFTSSFRMGQLLRFGEGEHNLANLKPNGDPLAFMVREFVPEVRRILKAGGCLEVDKNKGEAGEFLVAWKRNLFHVDVDLQAVWPRDKYTACGCGGDVICGALFATEGRKDIDADGRVRLALKAAEKHSAGVRGPFDVWET